VETEMTNRIETLRALQSRIRECKGADHALDLAIATALYPSALHYVVGARTIAAAPFTTYPDGLGACVSLLNAVLPGRTWRRDHYGWVGIMRRDEFGYWDMEAHIPPLANDCLTFIDAIIAAAIVQLETKEKANA
jgi:hypothetical protein